jgi:hypothetical protein
MGRKAMLSRNADRPEVFCVGAAGERLERKWRQQREPPGAFGRDATSLVNTAAHAT